VVRSATPERLQEDVEHVMDDARGERDRFLAPARRKELKSARMKPASRYLPSSRMIC
jgi:hypothetical protein